jgi:predicted O-methyltransferase YrrM
MEIERLRSDRLFGPNRTVLADAERFAADLGAGASIDGLIHPREGLLLYVLARRAAALGNIVEIGAYKGRSTWYLAHGLEDAGSAHRVISIDPHEAREQRDAYFETLERFGLADRVEPRVAYSHDVADEVDGPIGMLWIDGDHSYASVRRDFDDWFPKLEVGGWYAMHDTVNAWYGPTRLAREIMRRGGELADIGVVWLTLFGRKCLPSVAVDAGTLAARVKFELLTLAQARRSGFGAQKILDRERRVRR